MAGCGSTKEQEREVALEPAVTSGSPDRTDHAGYALLFDLLSDEKDVAKIRFIKRPRPETTELLKQISDACSEAHGRLEGFAKVDKKLNLKDKRLPSAEVTTRDAIAKSKQKALLSSKGKELEIELLLSQAEALTYGSHLAKAISLGEKNSDRRVYLEQTSEKLSALRQKVGQVLSNHYNFTED